tara:strand:+ start:604 stop:747 length:144 start_codon:yes stop_codon:yes gene_type:complete
MSKFDESIFGRIALFNDYISKDQLESILQIRRNPKEAPPQPEGSPRQ